MNYKVRVENEAESKEVQELFFELGYKWNGGIKDKYLKLMPSFKYITAYDDKTLTQGMGLYANQELTIPRLRDLVVLHRNDVRDANCKDDTLHDLYIDSNKVVYFYHHGELKWVESAINGHDVYLNMVKPIEKEEMKEYLNPLKDGGYELIIPTIIGCADRDWIEVPEGAEIALYPPFSKGIAFFKDGFRFCYLNSSSEWGNTKYNPKNLKHWESWRVAWQRNPPVDAEFNIEKAITESELMVRENSKHSHYFKDVSGLTSIDVYKVLQLFEVIDPCLQHIVKKALCAGQRGHKDFKKDIQDILDTAKRCVEIN